IKMGCSMKKHRIFCAPLVASLAACAQLEAAAAQFKAASLLPAGESPLGVSIGDFNSDGKLDFAVSNQTAIGNVSVFLGDGQGHFGTALTFPTGALYSVAIASGDFNGDG